MYFLPGVPRRERFRHKPFPASTTIRTNTATARHEPHESPWWSGCRWCCWPSRRWSSLSDDRADAYGAFFGSVFIDGATRRRSLNEMAEEFHGAMAMALHALGTLPFWLTVAGVVAAWASGLCKWTTVDPGGLAARLAPVRMLENKYYFDWFNENVLAAGARASAPGLWKGGDQGLIDGLINGRRAVGAFGRRCAPAADRLPVTGTLVMVLGVFALLSWQLWPFTCRPDGR